MPPIFSVSTDPADGAEALEEFDRVNFDIVLTDWNMPNKSGLDVVKEIRARGSDVPVIMITTVAERRRVKEAINEGVTDYLTKPFDVDTLRSKLSKYLLV